VDAALGDQRLARAWPAVQPQQAHRARGGDPFHRGALLGVVRHVVGAERAGVAQRVQLQGQLGGEMLGDDASSLRVSPRHGRHCVCSSSLPGGVHVSQRICDGVLGRFIVADADLAQLLVQMQRVEHLVAHGLAALRQVSRAPGLRDHAQERVTIGKDTMSDAGVEVRLAQVGKVGLRAERLLLQQERVAEPLWISRRIWVGE